ncbi:MAG TPA: alpha/beta fold hydrolase [Geobacteraceae bacterium]
MPFLETSPGKDIYYEEIGEGRPLVMVHGWAMSHRAWRFQHELADRRRLLLPDLAGHGRSQAPAAGWSLEYLAEDIVRLFERLDLAEAVILGWSLGSLVTLAAFPAISERLAGVVLVGGTPRFTADVDYSHGLAANELKGMGVRLKRDYSRTMGEFFRRMFAPDELSRDQENRIAREIVMGGELPQPEAALACLRILATTDLREALPAIDRPVLLLHGSADIICPPGAARFMATRLPSARLVEFAGAGHAPFMSRPDEFNACLRRFIEEGL